MGSSFERSHQQGKIGEVADESIAVKRNGERVALNQTFRRVRIEPADEPHPEVRYDKKENRIQQTDTQ